MAKLKYSDKDLAEIAKKYNTKRDFSKKDGSAYALAIRRRILDDICSHMTVLCHKRRTNEELLEEARKYSTRQELRKNNVAVYSAIHKRKLQKTHFSHMFRVRKEWDENSVLAEAKKYSTRNDFEAGCISAYQAAKRLGILDDIKKELICPGRTYSDEEIFEEAKKYDTRVGFYRGSTSYHLLASRRGLLDEVCSHMKRSGTTSYGETKVKEFIQSLGYETVKLKDRKVKIDNKPHIKGFDIDIYVPSLKKGVEYDGDYYHSYEMIKRNRPRWPKDDLLNYHNIKDKYFASLGIGVLHVRESGWENNREQVKARIVDFFKGG